MNPFLAALSVPQGLRKPLAYIGGAAIVVAILWGLWARGDHYRDQRDDARTAFTETVANYRTAAATRKASDLANVERVNTESATISTETLHDYQDRLDSLRAAFADRVRRATGAHPGGSGPADLPGLSDATGRTDEAACHQGLPIEDALIASEQAEQLIALQAWVKKTALIDTNGETP